MLEVEEVEVIHLVLRDLVVVEQAALEDLEMRDQLTLVVVQVVEEIVVLFVEQQVDQELLLYPHQE